MDLDLSDSALSVHHHQQKQKHFGLSGQQQQVSELGLKKSPLYRCQSKSVEGLLQRVSHEHSPRAHNRPHPLGLNQLYKTTSLGQNFDVNDKAAASVNMARPKRAVSSIQLPSKGILKNKDEGQKHRKIRKAKSMETLSIKGQSAGPHMQSSVETLRDNFVKGKLEFSAFLDEITKQVISPSRLNSFRNNASTTPPSHKFPHEDLRQPAKASTQDQVQKSSKQPSVLPVKSNIEKGRTDSNKQSYKSQTGSFSTVPHQHQHHRSQEKQHPMSDRYRSTLNKKTHAKYSQLLNEDTSNNSESIQQEKHYQAKGKWDCNSGTVERHSGEFDTAHKVSAVPAGLGMEFTKQSSTVTAHNLENINKHKYMGSRRHSKQLHRVSLKNGTQYKIITLTSLITWIYRHMERGTCNQKV